MEITSPIPLARLPRASKADAVHFGSVSTLQNGLKKRRKEFCAAVDGDSLSLYEIQNGGVLASYPVPPTSHFLGAPCSLCRKVDNQYKRTTYCAIKRNTTRIESFTTSGTDSIRPSSTTSPDLRDQETPVALLELVPSGKENHILVVQHNGRLTTLSEDLQTVHIEALLSSQQCEHMTVFAIHCLSHKQAQKSVLKHRPDVSSAATPEASYLAVIYGHSGQGTQIHRLRYGVWMIDTSIGGSSQTGKSLYPIFEHELPSDRVPNNSLRERSCKFGANASVFLVQFGNTILTYDLTGLVPSVASAMRTGEGVTYETMPISSTLALCSSQDFLRLYDMRYQSIQVQKDLKSASLKRKRKVDAHNGSRPIEFIAFFPQSGRVIGRRRLELFAIDLSIGSTKRIMDTGSNLLHNIGRGIANDEAPKRDRVNQTLPAHDTTAAGSNSVSEWEPIRRKLDDRVEAGDVAGFEKLFVEHMEKTSISTTTLSDPRQGLPQDVTAVPSYKFTYLLSKLFRTKSSSNFGIDEDSGKKWIEVRLRSLRLVLWISSVGLLSRRRVESALASSVSDPSTIIDNHAVGQALLDTDPTCTLLVTCLKHGFSPYVDEQAALVQLLIQQALDNSAADSDQDHATLAQSNGTMDLDLPSTKTKTNIQTLISTSPENSWLSTSLQSALIAALERLGNSSHTAISSILSDMLSQREVLALIQFLRQQLFQGGHTRTLQSLPASEDMPRTLKLDAAVRILSSCVDAIGPLGFYGALDNEDFIGNIIPELVTEISNTKQSLEDVSELQGILRETLRYQESIARQQASGARMPAHITGSATKQRSGVIMTVYSEAVEGEEDVQPGAALPLSLKVENAVSALRHRKGGGQAKERSVRQTKMLANRNKGQYSFERLVL